MMQRRHAAVVQVREIRPHAGQRRRGVSMALPQCALPCQRTAVERVDEPVGHDVDPGSICAYVDVHARPPNVPPAIVIAMTSSATDRAEQVTSLGGQDLIDLVRITWRPEVANDGRELLL